MRAMFKLTFMPSGQLQDRLQTRLQAMRGVRSAVLEPQERTAYVDYDPPLATDADIETVIRSCGVDIESWLTDPDDVMTAVPPGRAIAVDTLNPDSAMSRMLQETETKPGKPGGSLMPETGESTRAAFPGHSL